MNRGVHAGVVQIAVAALVVALVAALAILAFTRSGRRAIGQLARRLDSRVEGLTEPDARIYARFAAPALRRLYGRVADDVAAELAAAAGHAGATHPQLAILDVGCGPGDLASLLADRQPGARVVGLDISPAMVELARARDGAAGRLRFEIGDVAGLPFDAGSFDVVVSTLSLHHWPDPGAGFAEIARVLRPNGTAFLYDLRMLTLESETLPGILRRAALPHSRFRRELMPGGLAARLFVRFRIDGPPGEPA